MLCHLNTLRFQGSKIILYFNYINVQLGPQQHNAKSHLSVLPLQPVPVVLVLAEEYENSARMCKTHIYIAINIKRSASKTAIKWLVHFPMAVAPLSLIYFTPWRLRALSCLSSEQEPSG